MQTSLHIDIVFWKGTYRYSWRAQALGIGPYIAIWGVSFALFTSYVPIIPSWSGVILDLSPSYSPMYNFKYEMLKVGLTPNSSRNSILYALSFIFIIILNRPIVLGINIDFGNSTNLPFHKCNHTKSHDPSSTYFLPLYQQVYILSLIFSMFYSVVSSNFRIKSARSLALGDASGRWQSGACEWGLSWVDASGQWTWARPV